MIRDDLFEAGIALRRTMFGRQGADDQIDSIMYCGLPAAVDGFRTLGAIVAEGVDEPAR